MHAQFQLSKPKISFGNGRAHIGPARATLTIGSVSAWPFYSFLGGHCGFQEVWGAVARQRVGLEPQTHRFLNERGRLVGGR